MTQESSPRAKPQFTNFMAGWLVFVGLYQIFLAAKHGGLYFGQNNLMREELGLTALVILYGLSGVLLLIVGYAIWSMKWWAFPVGLVVQGMVIPLALIGIVRWLALGQTAPVIWDVLDLLFAVVNLAWAFSREVRVAFTEPEVIAKS